MNRTNREILEPYKLRLKHYQEKGVGAKSDLSKNTTITPQLIKNTLTTYINKCKQYGVMPEDFSDITDDKYRAFLAEIKGSG